LGADAGLEIHLLGGFWIVAGGQPVETHGKRQVSLLAYLLLHAGRPLPRAQVAYALWPDSTEPQALTNLRGEIHMLRGTVPDLTTFIRLDHRSIEWLTPGTYRLDVHEFETALARAQLGDREALAEAVASYGGDLVPTSYEDWIEPERDRLRALFLDAIDELVDYLEETRRYREAIVQLRRRISVDPLHEPAYQALMRVAALADDRSTALQAYHACVAALRNDLGIEPTAATQVAYERLVAADRTPTEEASPSSGSARHALVGRDAELATLARTTRRAAKTAVAAVVRGEAGIGKTRLIEELLQWCHAQGLATGYARSYGAEGGLAYAPVAEWFRARPLRNFLDALDPVWASELARIIPDLLTERRDVPQPEPMTESWQRKRLFEALLAAARTIPSPFVLVLDDAQWADSDTLEWLHYLLRADPPVGVLVVTGVRSDEELDNPGVVSLLRGLRGSDQLVELDLGPLSEVETEKLAANIGGRPLEPAARDRIYRETQGQPLFVVEVMRADFDREGLAPRTDSGDRLSPRVQEVITQRLERLSNGARAVAELAATIGRAFESTVLEGASDLDESTFAIALDELWRRQIVRANGFDTYDFTHDRIRDVAYRSVSPARRGLLHRRVARSLEALHADDLDAVSAQLASHHEAAGLLDRAIDDYERATRVAVVLSSHAEAARLLSRAIELLGRRPASPDRDRRELDLRLRLAPSVTALRGFASPEHTELYERLRVLAEAVGDQRSLMDASVGLYGVTVVGGPIGRSLVHAEAMSRLARNQPAFLAASHLCLAGALLHMGEIGRAIELFDDAVAAYVPGRSLRIVQGVDTAVFSTAWGSHALWLAGRTNAAAAWSSEAVRRAEELEPFERALAEAYAALLDQVRGRVGSMRQHLAIASDLCARYDNTYYAAWCEILGAWAERETSPTESVGRIQRALAGLDEIGANLRRPYYLSLLADAFVAAGRPDLERETLRDAQRIAATNDEHWWTPEILRRLSGIDADGPKRDLLETALNLARQQGSRALALRAAIDLAARNRTAATALHEELRAWPERDGDETVLRARALLVTLSDA
jgi:DNA-binding SARP family transcriptional activator/tetratricopeptide (TPR) repeat protein